MDVISRSSEPTDDRSTVYCPDVIRQVIKEKRPLVFSNVEIEEEVDVISTLKIQKIRSVLCAPLISHSYMMGVIYIDSRKGVFAFSKADISLFVDLCKRTALFLMQAHGAFESTTLTDSLHSVIPVSS
jgi:GAF domain-containing protein